MRVAVQEGRAVEDPPGVAQRLDDARRRLPDVLAAEERQGRGVGAVALDRVQDGVEREAVDAAGIEVLDAIGRRRVDDAGAVFGRRVLSEVDRRDAVVAPIDGRARVAELETVEPLAGNARDDAAFEPEAREALLDQRARENEQAALGIDERILELRVEVERL